MVLCDALEYLAVAKNDLLQTAAMSTVLQWVIDDGKQVSDSECIRSEALLCHLRGAGALKSPQHHRVVAVYYRQPQPGVPILKSYALTVPASFRHCVWSNIANE